MVDNRIVSADSEPEIVDGSMDIPSSVTFTESVRLPALIERAGERAGRRFLEFFTANIRNRNTRKAYLRAVGLFLDWCEQHQFALDRLEPMIVATYIEKITQERSAPTVKQHLAAIRMLFDYLVLGQVVPFNPADAVRGPKHVVKKGKTPVLYAEDARLLLDSIDTTTVIGLRDRALITVMTFSFARVGAVVKMRGKDYFVQNRKAWFVLHEKAENFTELECITKYEAADYLDVYITEARIVGERDAPLFRSIGDRGRNISERAMHENDVLRMIKRRSLATGLPAELCCHTFRATGITNYLQNGGSIETAARIAAHESTRTTQLYNRTDEEVSIGFNPSSSHFV